MTSCKFRNASPGVPSSAHHKLPARHGEQVNVPSLTNAGQLLRNYKQESYPALLADANSSEFVDYLFSFARQLELIALKSTARLARTRAEATEFKGG
jgi:hypothetical protein